MAIEEGRAAPAFTLKDSRGNKVALRDYRGRHVVIYFYPRDNTSGCTKAADHPAKVLQLLKEAIPAR